MQQASDLRQRAIHRSSIKAAGALGTGQPSYAPEVGARIGETQTRPVPSQRSQDRGHELEPNVKPCLPLGYLYPFPGGAGSIDIPKSQEPTFLLLTIYKVLL